MIQTHNLPLLGSPQVALQPLIHTGALRPTSAAPPGCSGSAFTLRDPQVFQVIDDFGAELAGTLVQVNLFRLPTAAYAALVAASTRFRQHDTATLASSLRASPRRPAPWWDTLAEVVRQGAHPLQATDYLPRPLAQQATWLPAATVVTCSPGGQWTLTLSFHVITQVAPSLRAQTALGIDVGMSPLAAVAGEGHAATYRAAAFLPPDPAQLARRLPDRRAQHLARRLHHRMLYEDARYTWELLLAEQLPQAAAICVERLTLPDMQARFRRASTELAIADFLLGWLPQLCHERRVPLVRVDPAYSSQRCAQCHRRGTRRDHGRVLVCPVHGRLDVHINAARVIRQLGLAATIAGARHTAPWTPETPRRRP